MDVLFGKVMGTASGGVGLATSWLGAASKSDAVSFMKHSCRFMPEMYIFM